MLASRASGVPPFPPQRPAPFAEGCILAGSPGAGTPFPQPTHDQDRLRMDDRLEGNGWLITRRPTTIAIEGLQVAELAGEPLAPFRADLEAWLDARHAEAVLVRPDRCVFGTGEPAALAAAWATALDSLRQAA
jgi:3-(3-hydroxy-phenyl)propionate hydroxylase